MLLEAGHRIGPYEVVSVLGSGGMGTVYLARDTRLDRRVALKFVTRNATVPGSEDARRRILHEARAASALSHPSICHVYDVGGEGTGSWIAMEYVENSAPYFDPSGRYIAYLRQRPIDAPPTVAEHTLIHEVATGQERIWPEPHTHVDGWSSDGASIVGWQHDPKGALPLVVICRVRDASCRTLTHGLVPKWSASDGRIYFLRATSTGVQDLWSITADGADERRVGELATFRPIDIFFDISRQGVLAPFTAGRQELWTAAIR